MREGRRKETGKGINFPHLHDFRLHPGFMRAISYVHYKLAKVRNISGVLLGDFSIEIAGYIRTRETDFHTSMSHLRKLHIRVPLLASVCIIKIFDRENYMSFSSSVQCALTK